MNMMAQNLWEACFIHTVTMKEIRKVSNQERIFHLGSKLKLTIVYFKWILKGN